MTVARATYASLLKLAHQSGCVGVEVRTDLSGALFDGQDAASAGAAATDMGLRLLALSEVSAFDDMSERAFESLQQLASTARECGAEALILIPRNDGKAGTNGNRLQCLRETLVRFAPELEENNLLGFIEPLGFEQCSLRSKAEIVVVLEELELTHRFKLVHDTFHHHLGGAGPTFAQHTGLVHVSGVVDKSIPANEMRDDHRVMVDDADVLNNMAQLNELRSNNYAGPVSIEAFAPHIHDLPDPQSAIDDCFNYIESNMTSAIV